MIKLFLLAVLLLTISSPVFAQVFPAPEGDFHVEYDRFKDKTTSSLLQLQVAEKEPDVGDYQRLYLSVWVQFDSPRPTRKPPAVGVIFTSWSLWNDKYKEAAAFDAIVDGERKSYGVVTPISRRVINGKYVASMGTFLPFDEFQRIVWAKKTEMRVGTVEFSLSDHAFNMLRDFARRVQP
jgi:hypothetical protein